MIDVGLAGAFIVGLLGGVHCLGMCGGIVGALTLGQPQQNAATSGFWLLQLGYNLGRILSYMLAGMIAGGLGLLLAQAGPTELVSGCCSKDGSSEGALLILPLLGFALRRRRRG